MVGRRGRPPKRKMEELQEDLDGKSKSAKEAKIEAISLDASEPACIALLTLKPDTWMHCESSEEWSEDHNSRISEAEEGREGTLSQGTCWRGIPDPPPSQVALSFRRVSNGEAFDCETQTFHFIPMSASKVVVVPDSDTPETIKVEIDTDQQEEFLNHPLVCCVEGCGARSDTNTTSTFYTVPRGKEKSFWAETLEIPPCGEGDTRQHVCSKHFITPSKLLTQKGKTRKKKTCDMLVAEEAEKIRQGLSSGRPKRTPKPNKNYDWAEIVPLIKSEPDELEDEPYLNSGGTLDKTGGTVMNPRKPFSSFLKEDKENKRPTSDTEGDAGREDEDEEEEEEDMENISLPSHPRPPPPKPKGRPHRIRDSGTQTEGACRPPGPRLPLREVKVQCNINSEPPSPCTSCSYLNWLRLEELLVDCATKIEGDLCVPVVQECLRKVLGCVPHPTHATNVLKLLSGDERDALENTSDIILVPNQEDEVEIENVIHTAVEEPVTGLREIIPKTWQKKAKWKKALTAVEAISKEEEEEDLDGFGIQEATEMDDDEFHPGYLEGEETEEEDDQGLDDEDWTINKQDRDSRPGAKKKLKKIQQHSKVKKDHRDAQESGEVCCRHCRREFVSFRTFDAHRCRGRLSSTTSAERRFPCNQCGKTFTQKISLQYHNIYVHNGERKAACPHCEYRAPDKAKLSVHLRTHSKLRPFVCELCRASFKFRSTYRSHVARHTNSGNYVCSQCNKAFTMASELREHRRIHGQERPFVCPLCAMTFKQKKQLRVHHRAVHLRDKRYVCEVCGSCHINNWNLRAHMKTHIRTDTTYANFCKHCGSIFRGRAGLAAHMRLRHNSEYNQQNPPEEWEEEEDDEEEELHEKYKVVLSLASREAIEHVIEPQQKQEVKMIEVYSCSCCGQLCESLEQLTAHSFNEH